MKHPKHIKRRLLTQAVLLAMQAAAASAAFAADDTAVATPAAPVVTDNVEAVIVTGTRRSGLKAVDSASPIQVLDSGIAAAHRPAGPDPGAGAESAVVHGAGLRRRARPDVQVHSANCPMAGKERPWVTCCCFYRRLESNQAARNRR